MLVLTPAERRAALLLVLLLLLGALADLFDARRTPPLGPDAARLEPVAPPPAGPEPARAPAPAGAAPPSMDLNRADARQLESLPGVGPVLAARIVEHRRRFGPFRSLDDLRAVRGIGPRLYGRLEPLVRVSGVATGHETPAAIPASESSTRDSAGRGR